MAIDKLGAGTISAVSGTWACNCQYGPDNPNCCINRSRQDELYKAWKAGQEGKPCPPPAGVRRPTGVQHWQTSMKIDGLHDAPFITDDDWSPLDRPRPPVSEEEDAE